MHAQHVLSRIAAVVVIGVAFAGQRRAESAEEHPEPVYVIAYGVSDLPVWRRTEDGQRMFDASVLIEYIKQSCPDEWGGRATIGASAEDEMLIIVQTRANHQRVGRALSKLWAFGNDGLGAVLPKKLDVASQSLLRVLVFVADPHSEVTAAFFRARHDENNDRLQGALGDYTILCAHRERADSLDRWNLTAPRREEAVVAVLEPDGSLVAAQTLKPQQSGATIDRAWLTDFLESHALSLPSAEELLASAKQEATQSDRRVLVQVVGSHCGPCIRLSRYLEDQNDSIAKDYVRVKLDSRMPHASQVIAELRGEGKGPIPWMAILAPSGGVLATSDGPEGNIGYPRTDVSRRHFEQMLRSTAKRLSDQEITAIVDGLSQ